MIEALVASQAIGPTVAAASGPSALEWLRAAGPIAGALSGGASGGPSRSEAPIYSQHTFDSSGWVVDFGEGGANASRAQLSPWWILPACLGALALVVWARRRGG